MPVENSAMSSPIGLLPLINWLICRRVDLREELDEIPEWTERDFARAKRHIAGRPVTWKDARAACTANEDEEER
jgi:hypothetical protein